MKEGAIDFNMALGLTLALQHRHRIVLVSEDVPRDKAQKMGFLYAETFGHAFDLITAEHPRAEVHVIPSGGVVLPVI
jgi:nickel-dependent lactate racemase